MVRVERCLTSMKIVLDKVASYNVVLVRNTTPKASICFYLYYVYAQVVVVVLFGVNCAALLSTV